MWCPECEEYEWKQKHRFRPWPGRTSSSRIFAGMGDVMMIALGAVPATHYERHREEFAQTGSDLEFARMLRCVQ